MRKIKYLFLLVLAFMACMCLTACRPYNTPQYEIIEPQQTAFLIPLIGDTESQASFESEEMLAKAKVAAKEVQIPKRWVQKGRLWFHGEYRPTAQLIKVDRTPVTREWNSTKDNGTSSINQAIYAESKESIGFSAGMNCAAQIDTENDAVLFLYSYNGKTLEEIMDSEIRATVEASFVEACATRTLNEILADKETLMNKVKEDTIPKFKERGITITVLGMKDGLEYDDPSIQKAINEKFSSEQQRVVQENANAVALSKAQAEADAIVMKAEAEAKANKLLDESLSENLIKAKEIEKWDGSKATIRGAESLIVDGTSAKESKSADKDKK